MVEGKGAMRQRARFYPTGRDGGRAGRSRHDLRARRPWTTLVGVLPRVLVIAGSDSGGGAGIQADIKTITALGGYASTAVTALTAQNTRGVFAVSAPAPEFVAAQIRVVLEDIGADAVKTGMLHDARVIDAVAAELERRARRVPIVVDPVMVAKGGARLLAEDAREALIRKMVPLSALLTPNLEEAEVLTGMHAESAEDLARLGLSLIALGAGAVLVKGGHLPGERVTDVLCTADGEVHRFEGPRIETRSTHGTGCTLSSAIAVGLAEGLTLKDATARAREFVVGAIRAAPGFGSGHGPLNHVFFMMRGENDA